MLKSKIIVLVLGLIVASTGCAPKRCPYSGCGAGGGGCAQVRSCCQNCPHCSASVQGGGTCGQAQPDKTARKGSSCCGGTDGTCGAKK